MSGPGGSTGGGTHAVDEIRIGFTYQDVVSFAPTTVVPAPGWVFDSNQDPNCPGKHRSEYFDGQQISIPYVVINTGTLPANITLNIAPRTNHSTIVHASTESYGTLPKGIWTNNVSWSVNTSVVQVGFYDVRITASNAAAQFVCADTGWLTNQPIHVCRGNPVILVHGSGGGSDGWCDMARLLEESDHLATVMFDYEGMTTGADNPAEIEHIAAAFMGIDGEIAARDGTALPGSHIWTNSVGWVTNYFNSPRVDVVAHSLGGLAVRAYMTNLAMNYTDVYPYSALGVRR